MLLIVKPDKIRERRRLIGATCYKVAKASGLPVTAIYRLEDGTTKATNHLRAKVIAKALGCALEDLFEIPSNSAAAIVAQSERMANANGKGYAGGDQRDHRQAI